jgi:hypothetical protein
VGHAWFEPPRLLRTELVIRPLAAERQDVRPRKRQVGMQMVQGRGRTRAAIGFSVKSGWASAVLLIGSATSPRVVDSRRVELSDPAIPESRQPYHAAFGTAREAGPELSRLVSAVKRFGRQSVRGVIRHYQTVGYSVRGAGVVVGSLIDPKRIANDHIRIHALEGQLFRSVVQDAAAGSRLPCSIWRVRDLHAEAAGILKQPEPTLRDTLGTLGREVGGPWRAEQKTAALAAWLVLLGRSSVTRTMRN